MVRFWAIFSTTFCSELVKTITAPYLIFVVICVEQCGVVWCDLEFSQNYNSTALHFCSHICGAVYKMHFEVNIFFKFLAFLPSLKLIFFFLSSFKLLS